MKNTMSMSAFGRSGIPVSEVGLGCWQLGGSDWGDVDDASAFEILDAAVEQGVTFFDTADVYGAGRSETLIGKFLKSRSPQAFVATKLGRAGGLFPDGYTEAGLQAATEASLKRLGAEALDLTQLHCVPTETLRRGEVFEWLRALQRLGKIKQFGASVESMEEALICLEQPGLASLQIIFNIFRQKPISALFSEASKRGVAIIVRLPLASGLLSGKMTAEAKFPENDHRHYNRDGQYFNVGETFAGLPYSKGVELADALRRVVDLDALGMTMAQMAQRWILDFDAVTVAIPGASRRDQVVANASVSALPPLPAEVHVELGRFYEQEVAPHIRGPY